MLFNSYIFIFGFLPVTLAGFYLLGARSREWALAWVISASLFFYAWWRPINVLIILPSIAINFVLGRALLRLRKDCGKSGKATAVLLAGILFNVAFLGYFKYVNFFRGVLNDVADTHFVFTQIILPLGISFITFQKIAFLIDVHAGRIESFTLRDYGLFVLFFPQLIAGPIVHYREMMPQFQKASCSFNREDVSAGLTLFLIGLFKKVVLADTMASFITPIYDSAARGAVSLFPAWIAAVGFTLQIYFDFSGYTDMALGLGRFFGVRLPSNFDSPLKASSIIDFWLRWHMTLTRFLTAYLYNPLVLWLTRRRLQKGLPALSSRKPTLKAFFQLLAGPTILTMFVSGLWHGAGYLFILWGLLHGVYLVINHAWRIFCSPRWANKESFQRLMQPAGFVFTFLSIVFAMVLFRSPTGSASIAVLRGMLGLGGIVMPQQIFERVPLLGLIRSLVVVSTSESATDFVVQTVWVLLLLGIALVPPNSVQILARHEPGTTINQLTHGTRRNSFLEWQPSLPWAVFISTIAIASIFELGGRSEFLYWQF